MNSRERVRTTYAHKEPDSVPVCIGGTGQKFSKAIYLKVKEKLKINDVFEEELILDEFGSIIHYHPIVLDFFNNDFRHIHINRIYPIKLDDGSMLHELGFKMQINQSIGTVNIVSNPLKNSGLEEIDKMKWPDPRNKKRIIGIKEYTKNLFKNSNFALASYKATLLGIFDLACTLRSMDDFLIDLLLNKKYANKLLDKILEYNFLIYEFFLKEVGEYLDVIEFNDDLGTQNNSIISPELFREFFKPRYKEFINMLKKMAKNAKIFFHSCGSIYNIIPDFIELGIDILNPVQPLANNMDSYKLKKEFGKDICFQGGIDLQKAMRGSQIDVENETRKRIKAFAPGGGYVLAAANNITNDIPLDNVFVLFRYAKQFGNYPIN